MAEQHDLPEVQDYFWVVIAGKLSCRTLDMVQPFGLFDAFLGGVCRRLYICSRGVKAQGVHWVCIGYDDMALWPYEWRLRVRARV